MRFPVKLPAAPSPQTTANDTVASQPNEPPAPNGILRPREQVVIKQRIDQQRDGVDKGRVLRLLGPLVNAAGGRQPPGQTHPATAAGLQAPAQKLVGLPHLGGSQGVAAARLLDQRSPLTGHVPFINQYAPDGQSERPANAGSNCGPTAMAMIARLIGYRSDLASNTELIAHLGQLGKTDVTGTDVQALGRIAGAMGRSATIHDPGPDSADWIAGQLRAGNPVVLHGNYWELPPDRRSFESYVTAKNQGQPKADPAGHYVLVTGIDEQGRFHVNDPGYSGGNDLVLTRDQLVAFFQATATGSPPDRPAHGKAVAIGPGIGG